MHKTCIMVALVLLTHGPWARAEWRWLPHTGWFSELPSATGNHNQSPHTLTLTCYENVPTVLTAGYPAVAGRDRNEDVEILIDGQRFQVTGRHSPGSGLWTSAASDALVDALKRGRQARVTPNGQPSVVFSLKGSSEGSSGPIDAALRPCQSRTATGKASLASRISHAIRQACDGPYTLEDGAQMSGLIDGDEAPDTVINWGAVKCANPERGRTWFCGAANCQVTVFLTQAPQPQELLAPHVEVFQLPSGRSLVRTGGCTGAPGQCDAWRWTGTTLEMQR